MLHAQSRMHGRVLDADSRAGSEGVHIRVIGSSVVAVSGSDGSFHLDVGTVERLDLELTRVGHSSLRRTVLREEWVGEGKVVVFELQRAYIDLPAVTVERPAPEVIYGRSDLHVGDHHANAEGMWVLTYERPQLWHREAEAGKRVFRDARLHLLDTSFVEQCSIRLPEDVVGLRYDHEQRTIVEGLSKAWFAELREGEIHLVPVELEYLHGAVLPWTDSIPGVLLGSTFNNTFPAFDHIAFHTSSQEMEAICAVEDTRLMELFRSQYKYMSGRDKVIAMDMELETGIDREIIAGYMTEFHRDPYFDPPYAPLFVVNDTLCVFDHFKEKVRRFTIDLRPVDEVPISHHKDKAWRTRLIQDPATGAVHAVFARGVSTWLRTVDPSSGALGPIRMLTYRFPEDVQVYDGHVYYVYRTFGSLQRRTLYREPIQ